MKSEKSNHIDMKEKDLKKLSKSQLIKLLLKQNAKPTPKIVIVDDYKPVPKTRKNVKQMVKEYEENIILPPPQFRDDYKPVPNPRTVRPIPKPSTVRPIPKPRTDLQKISTNDLFNFDDDIIQKENASLKNFKIINTRNVQN